MSDRSPTGQFILGHKNIGGRKIGSRNRLAVQYSDDLYGGWKKYGKAAIKALGEAITRDKDINAAKILLSTVSNHLPREAVAAVFHVDAGTTDVDVFSAAYDMALRMAAGTQTKLIEHDNGGDTNDED